MKITTLVHIYDLLQEDVKRHEQAVEILRDARNIAEEEKAENFESIKALYQKEREALSTSRSALIDFEEKEW